MLRKSLVVVPAVAALAFASPAFAAPPYDIFVGGNNTDRDVSLTGVASPINFIAHGQSGDVPMDCQTSTAEGVVHAGPVAGTDPDPAATLTSTDWETCSGPLGLQMTVVPSDDWHLNTDDPNVTGPPAADTAVAGWIDHVNAYVFATNDEASCNFTVTGSAEGHFDEVNQVLAVNEDGTNPNGRDLTISVAGGGSTCFGLVTDGDAASFIGDYDVTTAEGAIDITDGA